MRQSVNSNGFPVISRLGLDEPLEFEADPFRGDVIPLKGRRWQGRYRKRVGRYRIIFMLNHAERIVEISAILLRNEQTYR